MRLVNKNKPDTTLLLGSSEILTELKEIVETGNKELIKDRIYREPYRSSEGYRSKVLDNLNVSYKVKCAYCEKVTTADIEHYRPKKSVKEDPAHPGYYWLCYEWSNLIPACINCNREGGKHCKFPIQGTRVLGPSLLPNGELDLESYKAYNRLLTSEKPLLLHPEIDNPEDFFEFDIDPKKEGIIIIPRNDNERAKETIKICLLNRQELKEDRARQIVLEFVESINSTILLLNRSELDSEDFKKQVVLLIKALKYKSLNESFSFTLLRKYIIKSPENFEKIVVPYFDLKTKNILIEAFKSIYPF